MESNHEIDQRAKEIWFRQEEMGSLQNKEIFTTVRLGNRQAGLCESKGCYQPGCFVMVKILKNPQTKKFADWQTEILITKSRTKAAAEIIDQDLLKNSLNQRTRADLIANLEKFYQRKIDPQELVTLIDFEYLDNLKTASDLVRFKALSLAQQPADNPSSLDFDRYTIPLIGHDYPARTALMWNAAYRELGLNAGNIMAVGDPAQSRQILEVLRRDSKYLGGGAGVGFKDEVIKALDELDPLAAQMMAVNIIVKTSEGKLKGYNTDGLGYVQSLEEKLLEFGNKIAGQKVLILGAGGTGNAISFALAQAGAHVMILNRTVEKAEALATRINSYFGPKLAQAGGRDLVGQESKNVAAIISVIDDPSAALDKCCALGEINLPLTESELAENLADARKILATLPKDTVISDIMLRQQDTATISLAKEFGLPTLDGRPMVLNQAIEAFWLVHGRELETKGISKAEIARIMAKANK